MSTIASPRPSISASSCRTSTSTDTTATTHAAPADRGSLRRNRAALRDYYNLKSANGPSGTHSTPPATPSFEADRASELDNPSFNSSTYISNLLAKEGIQEVLKVEAGLVSEIRNLDGERKALVYDNYSKLIAATDTIRNMREKMDPMTPMTSTLTPAIGHIAETASALERGLKGPRVDVEARRRKQEQQATVRWVVAAPGRLQVMVDDERREEAQREWEEISGLLEKWEGVRGVEDVRRDCLKALGEDEAG